MRCSFPTRCRLALGTCLILFSAALYTACSAGSSGLAVIVFVRDEAKWPIPGADVRLRAGPDIMLGATTDSTGTVTFPGLSREQFEAIVGLRSANPQPEYKASKHGYVMSRAGVSGGDYEPENLERGGRLHIDIVLLATEVDEDEETSWAARPEFTYSDLSDITFTDNKNGWIVGHQGTILHTEDGGLTWDPQRSGTADTLTRVVFADADHGWAIAPGIALLQTADGGVTWVPMDAGTAASIHDVAFPELTNGWAIGPEGILHSSDGGLTWVLNFNSTTLTLGPILLTDIAFPSSKEGWATGSTVDGETGIVLHSQDGGVTWSHLATEGCPLSAVEPLASGEAWVVGCDAYKVRAGKLSKPADLPIAFQYYGVAATSFGEAWIIGGAAPASTDKEGLQVFNISLGTVAHTKNGDTWETAYRGSETLRAITFTEDGHGWIVGDAGTVLSFGQATKRATPYPTPAAR